MGRGCVLSTTPQFLKETCDLHAPTRVYHVFIVAGPMKCIQEREPKVVLYKVCQVRAWQSATLLPICPTISPQAENATNNNKDNENGGMA